MGKMTNAEKEQWDKLYQYVRKEILLYDESQSIPPNLVLRLKGMINGKYIANSSTEDKANYSYEIILYTFQICKPTIMAAMSNTEFQNEQHRFNYICKIVESNINDVYLRVNKVKDTEIKMQNIDMDIVTYEGGIYQKKTENRKNSKLNELW